METFEADAVVAGAGVVGLAVARSLAMAGRDVLILEKNAYFGGETSARNSEVIHAGIYYDPGSLKARHSVAGKAMLYAYCRDRSIPFRNCGKLIVSRNDDETAQLSNILDRARNNGVLDLRILSGQEAGALEPALSIQAALRSPSTGIVDSHSLMLSLLGDAEAHNAQLALHSPIVGGEVRGDGSVELAIGGDEPMRLTASSFVNCAGLWAPTVSRTIKGLPCAPELALVKGSYFTLNRTAPFTHLIYPVPSDGGLGVHLTLDMAGRAKFGPDAQWLKHNDPACIDYRVSDESREEFGRAIRTYWPDVRDCDLTPGYAGVRPKISRMAYPDFLLTGPD